MSDSLRSDGSRAVDPASAADRDAKIEQLLLAGLDHYFAARYEQAINIWTRALFFDRGHPRARAYIERARSALAERLRESEELLHKGVAAFHRGDGDEAKRLLVAAIEGGAPADEAHAFLDRLNREPGTALPTRRSDTPAPAPPLDAELPDEEITQTARRVRSRARVGMGVALAAAVLAAASPIAVRYGFDVAAIFASRGGPDTLVAVPSREVVLPLPLRGEITLGKARSLAAGGRLHEALAALESIPATDPQRPEADRTRADIQRQLLALTPLPRPAPDRPDGPGR